MHATLRPTPTPTPTPTSGAGVEVAAAVVVTVSAPAAPLPFRPDAPEAGAGAVAEEVRSAARHLDLRRALLQRNLRLRSGVTHAIRAALHACDPPFTEVETPTLFRSSPEGAREFVVPVRPRGGEAGGRAYALTQSPQQWKQLLMVGGVDRYFQVARCYRDESGRADRQPEFTQVDVEMAWAGPADVMAVVERVAAVAWRAAGQLAGVEARLPSPKAAGRGAGASSGSGAAVAHTPTPPAVRSLGGGEGGGGGGGGEGGGEECPR
jgi:aspartyl-tRNA synthetase